jgi:hypothetical protein
VTADAPSPDVETVLADDDLAAEHGHHAAEVFPDADTDAEYFVCACGLPWIAGRGCAFRQGIAALRGAGPDLTDDEREAMHRALERDYHSTSAEWTAVFATVERILALRGAGLPEPSGGVTVNDTPVTAALAGVRNHNGTTVTPKNLRWAATHEALCRSYIFDVLNGLADALEAETGVVPPAVTEETP